MEQTRRTINHIVQAPDQNVGGRLSNITSYLKDLAHRGLQQLLLSIPCLSEMRLAGGRVTAFLRSWHYISRAKIEGDYFEFGVFQGMSFNLSMQAAGKFYSSSDPNKPRFFAFDSFAGLPSPDEKYDANVFKESEYSASRKLFTKRIRKNAKNWSVGISQGFYKDTLDEAFVKEHRLKKAAFVSIDCDIYESTIKALRSVTPYLQTGTVLYFDDWYFSGGDMTLGEPGACTKWLEENPDITLHDFGNVSVMGKLFLVNLKK